MVRYQIRDIIFKYAELMFNYVVRDGEKPYHVSNKYYGSPDLSELILLTNKVVDPYFEWPMSTDEFTNFINLKYGGIAQATQNYHSYWWTIQPRTTLYDGTIIEERQLRVDKTTYLSLPASDRTALTYYDYEMNENESRREISLIRKNYISEIRKEIQGIFTNGPTTIG